MAYSAALARAQYNANRAVTTLLQVMTSKDAAAASRVRAADALLDHAAIGGAFEDLTRKVNKLEQRQEELAD